MAGWTMTVERAKEAGWGEKAERFAKWWNEVDKALVSRIGLGIEDLEDLDYATHFEADYSPNMMAEIVMEEIGYPYWDDEFF